MPRRGPPRRSGSIFEIPGSWQSPPVENVLAGHVHGDQGTGWDLDVGVQVFFSLFHSGINASNNDVALPLA